MAEPQRDERASGPLTLYVDALYILPYAFSCFVALREKGVAGCTELPLLVRPEQSPLPAPDSTRLLARAAVARALDRTLSHAGD